MFSIFKKFINKEENQTKTEIKEEQIKELEEIIETEEHPCESEENFDEAYSYIEEKINTFEKRGTQTGKNQIKNQTLHKETEEKDIIYFFNKRKNSSKKLTCKRNNKGDINETKKIEYNIVNDKKAEDDIEYFDLEENLLYEINDNKQEISEIENEIEKIDDEILNPISQLEELSINTDAEEISAKSFFGMSFTGLKDVVSKTTEFFNTNIFSLGSEKEEIDDDLLDKMEEKFIRADIGVDTTVYIIERLREVKNNVKPSNFQEYFKNEFKQIIKTPGSNEIKLKDGKLNTFLITGVNGAGKTTLIAKLAYRYKTQGKKVLVAAGDTYRAAAEDQLEIWADRAGADIVRQDGADPASVVFDAIKKAQSENYDILLIDTAGRLHNKFNLMEELRKIRKIIDREAPDTLTESILVLDATTGQNGLKQAEVFKEAVDITSVGLTKLDGTAKGGVILGIAKELKLPVKLIGVGEKMEDLRDFNADDFIEALF